MIGLIAWIVGQLVRDMVREQGRAVERAVGAAMQVYAPHPVVSEPVEEAAPVLHREWVVADPTDGLIEAPPDPRVAWGLPPVVLDQTQEVEMNEEHAPWMG